MYFPDTNLKIRIVTSKIFCLFNKLNKIIIFKHIFCKSLKNMYLLLSMNIFPINLLNISVLFGMLFMYFKVTLTLIVIIHIWIYN